MTKRLRIPDEPRFVQAFALAVDPGDTLGLLMEIGALGSPDIGIVRRTREALVLAYDRASDRPLPAGNGVDWDQTHTISVLREALAQSDSAAYLAYRVRDNHRAAHTATEYAEALAVVGCAADTEAFRLEMHIRPGIEGTVSGMVWNHDLRQSRFRGTRKNQLQSLLSATATSLKRLARYSLLSA